MKNLCTIYPFYDSLSEQFRYGKESFTIKNFVSESAVPYIVCPAENMIPWVIRRTHSAGVIEQITLYFYPLTGGDPLEIHGEDAGITITSGTSYDHIIYDGDAWPSPLPVNAYYLVVYDSAATKYWYGETIGIRSTTDMALYLKLKFHNVTELASIPANFEQYVYVDQTLRAPLYIREDTGDKRNGILVKEKQVLLKGDVIRFNQCPEYLTDALIIVPMMDVVTLTAGGTEYSYDEIRVNDPEWSEGGYGLFAKIELQFISDLLIKKLNFKEMGYATLSNVIVKQDVGVLTVQPGGEYSLQVLFDEDMPDQNYTPAAYVISSGEMVDAQLPVITNKTVHGFLVSSLVACDVFWTAIKGAK
jgi:hypothetical protein